MGVRPQEELVEKKKNAELRHRIKQMPMKAVVDKTAGKAAERGLRLVLVSSYRNSKICPVHGEELSFPLGPRLGLCPRGHRVHRDVASVLNMLWKATEKLEKRYAEAVKRALSAVDERTLEEWSAQVLEAERAVRAEWPAVLARASPMTPPGEETVTPAGTEGADEPPQAEGRGRGQKLKKAGVELW
ncbi:zinc ribbon domain-containing protein [Pyrobaculum sp.]|uniref:zinc ribbon domain-containing protein n=1 Tax=Pyrobaculum sp. TaxID=2004705 RepID=UPI003D0DC4BD